MSEPSVELVETDPRFPSGQWTGFFLQRFPPLGRQLMELVLTFRDGQMSGLGRDRVGAFTIAGRYDVQDGRCHWTKTYIGRHDVFYKGFNEGKGIWGVWEIPGTDIYPELRGGFHIWPEGLADPSNEYLIAEADLPQEVEDGELVSTGITTPPLIRRR